MDDQAPYALLLDSGMTIMVASTPAAVHLPRDERPGGLPGKQAEAFRKNKRLVVERMESGRQRFDAA